MFGTTFAVLFACLREANVGLRSGNQANDLGNRMSLHIITQRCVFARGGIIFVNILAYEKDKTGIYEVIYFTSC